MSERHEKWERVEPGHVIPAGQPCRLEQANGIASEWMTGRERPITANDPDHVTTEGDAWFVDSSWRPPLDLPTEPTWGIATWRAKWSGQRAVSMLGYWRLDKHGDYIVSDAANTHRSTLTDFIRLTPEQVARIEAAS